MNDTTIVSSVPGSLNITLRRVTFKIKLSLDLVQSHKYVASS